MSAFWIDFLGYIGTAMLILAYVLVSYDKVGSKSMVYQMLNVVGSALLIINTIYWKAYPSTVINIFWIIIGASVLISQGLQKDQKAVKMID